MLLEWDLVTSSGGITDRKDGILIFSSILEDLRWLQENTQSVHNYTFFLKSPVSRFLINIKVKPCKNAILAAVD